ncbi:uncharacterized protein Z520_05513 [Fonsecaea multimorphosa CBS 102226]|uniref:Hydantoinase/oxoprolinase N-terminal domain-containing protein n=1 Tax=Fonsecaea multimorphosa CBS 102226 TaxID=1442371 RepID=A0A0D2JZU9_9EURO|nr:uncharacterized protein Z520_05513 [Fonsecaea multimorphosa CBS 102226]KIX99052.1 hypothetical protein Z520_05513 [Fonsecaea multimorphosa CBS 102226]
MTNPLHDKPLRIGVDVGGTNTDAVVLDVNAAKSPNRGVLAFCKTPTTGPNVSEGIQSALRNVLEQSNVDKSQVACVTIGTTHFINAVVEQDASRLAMVAVIRLSKSFTKEVSPFSDFPPALARIMNGYYGFIDGGLHIDGSQEAHIVEAQVHRECEKIRQLGIRSIVLSGVFSPLDQHFRQEHTVRDIILEYLPGVDVVCSSDISTLGFLERENAAILNASILRFARRTIQAFRASIRQLGLNCALFLTQNDGTVISASSAAQVPIRTFSSGATNSIRGAAYLGSHQLKGEGNETSMIVLDVGGTTSDVGVLLPSGFPRQSSAYVTVAGIKVNFSMPHVESIGLGGGSIIKYTDGGKATIGPESVGHLLTSKARAFGGDTVTATDIAVAHGANIGDPLLVTDITQSTIAECRTRIKAQLERVIDLMKTSPDPLPVLVVGGGSIIVPDSLEGVSELISLPYSSVANAVGAAVSKVSGYVDIIQDISTQSVNELMESARLEAVKRAVEAGADIHTVTIAEMEAIPVQYAANQARIIVRVVGDLRRPDLSNHQSLEHEERFLEQEDMDVGRSWRQESAHGEDPVSVDIDSYSPKIAKNERNGQLEWELTEVDVCFLADGCYVLGCAGGGSPSSHCLQVRNLLRLGHTVRIIDPRALAPDALISWGGYLGSPAVSIERLAGTETVQAVAELMQYLRLDSFDAVMSLEIGGANGLQQLLVGSSKYYDRPVVDADWMGRAYPTIWQTSISVYEPGELVPCCLVSGSGNNIVMTKSIDDEIVDRALRASCSEMGSWAGLAVKPTTADRIVKYGIPNTLSFAWRIGRCIARAQANNTVASVAEDIIEEAGGSGAAKVLFRGKIVSVERRLHKGHTYGELVMQQIPDEEQELSPTTNPVATGGSLKIAFKNENIYAQHTACDGSRRYIASVPDLIAVLDAQSGRALGVPEYRYGILVTVLGIACSPKWTDTEQSLRCGGPSAFGYDFAYTPLGDYVEPESVVLEYARKAGHV